MSADPHPNCHMGNDVPAEEKVPHYRKTWSGEVVTDRRLKSLNTIRARLLKNMTGPERKFARFMSGFECGRRPHPLWFTPQKIFNVADSLCFFVDFYFAEAKLAVELDGGHHYTPLIREQDAWRTRILEEHGVHVLRFDNADVTTDMPAVARTIVQWMLDNTKSGRQQRIRKHLARLRRKRAAFYQWVFPDNGDSTHRGVRRGCH